MRLDRATGRFDLGWLVKRQTSDTARAVGLADRGTIAPGMKADLNVIDFDKLKVSRPKMAFDLPAGAEPLARTDQYENQAFAIGNALALQFHPEVTALGLERWYVGHVVELSRRKISVPEMRAEARRNAPALEEAARDFWNRWLDSVL